MSRFLAYLAFAVLLAVPAAVAANETPAGQSTEAICRDSPGGIAPVAFAVGSTGLVLACGGNGGGSGGGGGGGGCRIGAGSCGPR